MQDLFGDIPFEAQTIPRGCGAACLAMIYRALGHPAPQAEIWPAIARRNAFASLASTTHLMARDALARGFAAVAVQARQPLQTLRACSDAQAHAILSLRLAERGAGTAGHYTVLLDIDMTYVTMHDPSTGPRRMLPHAGLLALWQPDGTAAEATGHVLIGIAPARPESGSCSTCRRPIPDSVACPRCQARVGLRPQAVIGCMAATCPARLWAQLCCPECDLLWNFGSEPTVAPTTPDPPAFDLDKVFAAVDAFTAATVGIAGAAARPDIKELLGLLAGTRQKLVLTLAEEASARARLTAMQQAAAAAVAAKMQAMQSRRPSVQTPPPAPPTGPEEVELDAEGLGRALLARLAA